MEDEKMTCPIIITEEENWFVAKEINTNVASQGKSISEALDNLREALELYFEDNKVETPKYVMFTTLEVTA